MSARCSVCALEPSLRRELQRLHREGVSLRALVAVAAQRGCGITKDPLAKCLRDHSTEAADLERRAETEAMVSMVLEVEQFTVALRAFAAAEPVATRLLAEESRRAGARDMAESLLWLLDQALVRSVGGTGEVQVSPTELNLVPDAWEAL